MELKNVIEILILVVFVAFLIIRGGENKRIVSKKKINQCIDILNAKLRYPRPEYHVDQSIIRRLEKNVYDVDILQEAALSIIRHCGLRLPSIRIDIVYSTPGVAGTYSNYYGQAVITITGGTCKYPYEILAVLVHECMHFYLNTIGLRLDDHMMNEYLTDVTTVYMGFYNIIEKGYFRHGYLTTNNLKYVRNKISNPRNNIVEFKGR